MHAGCVLQVHLSDTGIIYVYNYIIYIHTHTQVYTADIMGYMFLNKGVIQSETVWGKNILCITNIISIKIL